MLAGWCYSAAAVPAAGACLGRPRFEWHSRWVGQEPAARTGRCKLVLPIRVGLQLLQHLCDTHGAQQLRDKLQHKRAVLAWWCKVNK